MHGIKYLKSFKKNLSQIFFVQIKQNILKLKILYVTKKYKIFYFIKKHKKFFFVFKLY